MFERFTERARKVVVLAQHEAARLRHDYIGTEHLLLGLIREEDGVAAQVLSAAGVTLQGVRGQVESIVGYGREASGQAPFTPRSKNVLEASLGEALSMRHNYVGTEHLLLGLLSEPESVAATALSNLGADPGRVRQEVVRQLGDTPQAHTRRDPGPLERTREVLRRSFGRYAREDRPIFGRFTERGRKVVMLAQDEARHFNHNYIGTEHLLLGLLADEEGVAAQALRARGMVLDEARGQVEIIVGYGEEGTGAQAPFTPRSKKVLQLAEREALQLGHDYVSTEHVLLGLLRESEGVAARVLLNLNIDPDALRREVLRYLPDAAGPEADSLDEVELELEREEAGRMLFRGRVGGIRTDLNLPRPLTVTINADYSYRASVGFTDGSTTVEPADVADSMRYGMKETEARTLEAVIAMLGERLLGAFSAMLEVTVTVSGAPELSDSPASTFSVSATFRR